MILWASENPQTQFTVPGEGYSAPEITRRDAMDVSRAEMIEFFEKDEAFVFSEPSQEMGKEVVKGTHKKLCVKATCATITLSGPEDNLMMVSAVAPTDKTGTVQTSQAITMLMNTAKRFASGEFGNYVPTQLMTDLLQAQAAGENLEKSYTNNGYVFFVLYDSETQQAELRISPYNGFERPTGNLIIGMAE